MERSTQAATQFCDEHFHLDKLDKDGGKERKKDPVKDFLVELSFLFPAVIFPEGGQRSQLIAQVCPYFTIVGNDIFYVFILNICYYVNYSCGSVREMDVDLKNQGKRGSI